MPRVPVYESKVRTEALPAPKVGAEENALAAIGKGLSSVGDVAENIGADLAKERDREEKFILSKYLSRYDDREKERFFGDDGLFRRNGEAVYETNHDEYTRTDLSHFSGLLVEEAPENIRDRLRDALAERFRDSDTKVLRYSIEQREVAKRAAWERKTDDILRQIDSGIPVDDTTISRNLGGLLEFAPSIESAKATINDLRARNTATEIRALLKTGEIEKADAMLKERRGDIGKPAIVLDGEIQDARNRALINSTVAKTFAASPYKVKNDDRTTGWLDESAANQYWTLNRSEIPPALLEDADKAFAHEIARNRAVRDSRIAEFERRAQEKFNVRKLTSDISEDDASFLKAHAPKVWARFKDESTSYYLRIKAEERAKERFARSGAGAADQTYEMTRLADLRRGIVENPERYARMTPDQFQAEWEPALGPLYKKGTEFYSKHYEQWSKNPQYVNDATFNKNALKAALAGAGMKPGTERYKRYEREINDDLARAIFSYNADGKTVRTEDVTRMIMDMIEAKEGGAPKGEPVRRRPVVVPSGTKPPPAPVAPASTPAPAPAAVEAGELKTDLGSAFEGAMRVNPATSATGSSVPSEVRIKIIESFKNKKGRDPTDAEIERIYAKVSSKGVAP